MATSSLGLINPFSQEANFVGPMPRYQGTFKVAPNVLPASVVKPYNNPVAPVPTKPSAPAPAPQQQQQSGGLNADILRSRFGFNDPNVINGILSDPNKSAQYLNELNGGSGGGSSDMQSVYDQQQALVDQARNESLGYLDKQESGLREMLPLQEKQISQDYANKQQALTDVNTNAGEQFKLNQNKLEQTKQNALAQATRLYDQLLSASKQRFGGATSASEASKSILGAEQQRQAGLTQRDFMNNLSQLTAQKADIDRQYNTQVERLNSDKQSAIVDLKMKFNNQLLSIANDRSKTAMWASEQKLSALKDYAQQMASLSSKAQDLAGQLALQRDKQTQQFQNELALLQEKAKYKSPETPTYKLVQTDKGTFFYDPKDPTASLQDATGVIGTKSSNAYGLGNLDELLGGYNLN